MVRLSWQKEVEALAPSASTLLGVDIGTGMLGVAVTAPGQHGADFVSRFFAPWVGIPQDAVTGLAHTTLAPYWARLLEQERLRSRQPSSREGDVTVEVRGERVALLGDAVTIGRGTMRVPSLEGIGVDEAERIRAS